MEVVQSLPQSKSHLVKKLVGHQGVVAHCDFHPMGRHIATAGHDFSWRLWDIETGDQINIKYSIN